MNLHLDEFTSEDRYNTVTAVTWSFVMRRSSTVRIVLETQKKVVLKKLQLRDISVIIVQNSFVILR